MFSLPLVTWYRFLVWLGVGLVIYFSYGSRKSALNTPGGAPPAGAVRPDEQPRMGA
jgi:APA family basic amino acid/polyamine antiporter